MLAKVIGGPTAEMIRVIENEAALKAAKIARKIVSASREVVAKIEAPHSVAGKGLSRAAHKVVNRASRKIVAVAPTLPSQKTLRKRAKNGRFCK
jgi:hypothetical protein